MILFRWLRDAWVGFWDHPDRAYCFDEKTFCEVFGGSPETCKEIARRGNTVIVRNYRDCMFHVVDIFADGGPELVGEYAIYRNAVIEAELWEYSKQRKSSEAGACRDRQGVSRHG